MLKSKSITRRTFLQLKVVTLSIFSIFLFGCQTAQVKSSNVGFSPTVLTYKYNKEKETITKSEVFQLISSQLRNALSEIPDEHTMKVVNSGTPSIKGKTITENCVDDTSCTLKVNVINGGVYPTGVGIRSTNQTFIIPIQIIEKEKFILAKVTLSGLVETLEGRNLIYIPYSPYLTKRNLAYAFNKLSRISPAMNKQRSFSGEFDIDARDDVVYGNFKRLMGIYRAEKGKDVIGKKSIFNLKTPNKTIPLYIEVYPSRKGSLASYEFTLNYQLKPNGTNTFDAELPVLLTKNIKKTASL